MKKISYLLLIALALSAPCLHAMKALQAKQEQIATIRPQPTGEPTPYDQVLAELARLKQAERANPAIVSWMDRALYAVDEIKRLELKLEQLRLQDPQNKDRHIDAAKQQLKDQGIQYAQEALTGYNNNAKANELYKSNEKNRAFFDETYKLLCTKAGWLFGPLWKSTDK